MTSITSLGTSSVVRVTAWTSEGAYSQNTEPTATTDTDIGLSWTPNALVSQVTASTIVFPVTLPVSAITGQPESVGKLLSTLGITWRVHVTSFAAAYVVLSLLSLMHFLYVTCHGRKTMKSAPYHAGLAFCIAIMCVFRSFYLFYDPYSEHRRLHPIAENTMKNISLPCLTSAFHLLAHALVRMTKMRLVGKHIVSPFMVGAVIFLNFAISITTDCIAALYPYATYVLIACGAYFALWGFVYFVVYSVLLARLYKAVFRNRSLLNQLSKERHALERAAPASGQANSAVVDGNHLAVPIDMRNACAPIRPENEDNDTNGGNHLAVPIDKSRGAGATSGLEPEEKRVQITGPRKVPLVIRLTAIIAFLFLVFCAAVILSLLMRFVWTPLLWHLLYIETAFRVLEIVLAGTILLVSALPTYRL